MAAVCPPHGFSQGRREFRVQIETKELLEASELAGLMASERAKPTWPTPEPASAVVECAPLPVAALSAGLSDAQILEWQEFDERSDALAQAERDVVPGGAVELQIELGRADLPVDRAADVCEGTIVLLDSRAADPVDILANGRLIARGEVLVLGGKLCARVVEILPSAEVAGGAFVSMD